MNSKKIDISVSDTIGAVSGEVITGPNMKSLYIFAHGAGAGMQHPFMVRLSQELALLNIGSLRFNFPYMEKGSKRPDVPAVAEKTVKRAIETATTMFPGTPLLAGGKSFGGRMTSQALSKMENSPVSGIVFVGFPLHAPGKPGIERAEHLKQLSIPMLFLQGTRDALADINLIETVCAGHRMATLCKFEGADHSFRAGKKDLIPALAHTISDWRSR